MNIYNIHSLNSFFKSCGIRLIAQEDSDGNRTDFNGNSHSFSYDADNDWLTGENYADGTSTTFSYDALGNRASATDAHGSYSYSYDSRQRLTQEIKPDGTTLDYTYDEAGNKLSLSSTVNSTVTTTDYIYDELNRLSSVTDTDANVTTYGYDAVGNRASVDHSNGTQTTYSYDSLNRLMEIQHLDSLSNVMQSFSYLLDATGRRTQITEANGRTTDYSYDELYRLTDEVITDGINGNYSANYQYDKVGNRTQSIVNGITTAYAYDDNDRLTQQGGVTYSYDDNGNTLQQGEGTDTTIYQWDSQNRLVQSDETTSFGTTISVFAYDIDGNRIAKTVDDNGAQSSLAYVVDNNQDYAQVIHEIDNNTFNTEVSYTYGDDLLAQDRAGLMQIHYYDGLGSTRLLTDSSGNTTDSYNYEAFGDLLNQTGFSDNNYLFTGEQYDDDLDQYYLRARYYDQEIGRFLSMDEWQGSNFDPVVLHKYLYANVDPGNMVDPSGHFSIGSAMTAISIVGRLASAASTTYDLISLATGEEELSPSQIGVSVLASLGGGKILGILGKKVLNNRGITAAALETCTRKNSFVEGTLVKTSDGYEPIENIKIGDLVWSFNFDSNVFELKEVTHLITGQGQYVIYELGLDGYTNIETTENHIFMTDELSWKAAHDFFAGHYLKSFNGALPVKSINEYDFIGQVYNLSVAGNQNYLVSDKDVVAHNCPLPFGSLGVKIYSKTVWKGKGKDKKQRIDVENQSPGQRPGQIHYQDGTGAKYIYDPKTKSFPGAPRSVNRFLNNPEVQGAIRKAMRFLGEES